MSFNPSLFLALCVGYAVGDVISCDHHYDLKTGSNALIPKFVNWLSKNSFPELSALFSGIVIFPLSIFITYGLIDNVCYEYSLGNVVASLSPYPGSWVADYCDFEIEPTQKKALQVSLAVFYSWLTIVGSICLLSNWNKRIFNFIHKERSISFHKDLKENSYLSFRATHGEIILFFAVASLLIFNCVFWYYKYTDLLDNSLLYAGWMNDSVRRPTFFATMVSGHLVREISGVSYLVIHMSHPPPPPSPILSYRPSFT